MHALWVYQTDVMPKIPASYGYGACVPVRSADSDGWRGYWWAESPSEAEFGENLPVLIRARDVSRAESGESVDMFVPGLWGTPYITAYASWSPRRGYFVLYEGEVIPGYSIDGEWVLFRPVRQLDVLTPREFRKRLKVWEAEHV